MCFIARPRFRAAGWETHFFSFAPYFSRFSRKTKTDIRTYGLLFTGVGRFRHPNNVPPAARIWDRGVVISWSLEASVTMPFEIHTNRLITSENVERTIRFRWPNRHERTRSFRRLEFRSSITVYVKKLLFYRITLVSLPFFPSIRLRDFRFWASMFVTIHRILLICI